MSDRKISFLAFFLMWAKYQGWEVPLLHVRICVWMESCLSPERVLLVFRGAAKSTIYAVYKAWRLYSNRQLRSLVWSADGPTAEMLTADVINVLRNHPLCGGMLPTKPGRKRFWVTGARDARNASMRATGVESNVTAARADSVDFDDVEVPGNIETIEARKKLRDRISESTHLAVPGSQKTYIGTPHHHESIYPERIAAGADVLKIPLFEYVVRYKETTKHTRYRFNFKPTEDGIYVLLGINAPARLLEEGGDYQIEGNEIVFASPPGMTLDICSGCAWPERFTRADIAQRRKETLTLNAWDSQYQLEAKPITDVRLDPERMIAYGLKPIVKAVNRQVVMLLGQVQIVGSVCRWDCALGKAKSDASAFTLILTDHRGRLYWQFAIGLTGELDDQCKQVRKLVLDYHIPSVTVETNGPGGFVPPILRKHLAGLGCSVIEDHVSTNKNTDILDGFDAPLSNRFLWAHVSVFDSPAYAQMRDFNPVKKDQPDDFIDVTARAIKQTPVRIGNFVGIPTDQRRDNWRPNSGVHDVIVEHS
ncbi:transcriptional regulator [Herminiimonas sp. KBW02]|uniref:phage terminase large subunit n=1 Tax=Herminiimonas sp. KBW02 TaxID=2153363 RepID=UPI000F59603D|nr:phage terminase large subunit [Herminiimonas sp. KBW02]RQO38609.1 transcriptional regulator [Herminiimonas sp. KBW02]